MHNLTLPRLGHNSGFMPGSLCGSAKCIGALEMHQHILSRRKVKFGSLWNKCRFISRAWGEERPSTCFCGRSSRVIWSRTTASGVTATLHALLLWENLKFIPGLFAMSGIKIISSYNIHPSHHAQYVRGCATGRARPSNNLFTTSSYFAAQNVTQ